MTLYARLSHLLAEAQQLIDEHEAASEREAKMLQMIRLHIAAALLYVRKVHHRLRWW